MSGRLTATSAAVYRRALLAEQGGLCALCKEAIPAGEDVLDHDHKTGVVRGVLHRGCNSMLGHIENNRPRYKLTDVRRLLKFLTAVVEYIYRKHPPDRPLYHTHRTEDQKRELRNKRARVARAARKTE